MKNQELPHWERGSAIVWVFVLIALLGVLTVSMTRGNRTSLGNLDREKSDLAASEIIGYGQSVREAVRMLKINGCDDSYINFSTSIVGTSYDNTRAPTDGSCDVFKGTGGGISFGQPEPVWLDVTQSSSAHYGQWFPTGDTHIAGVGTAGNVGPGCPTATSSDCKELIIGLPYINLNICKAINRKLGFGDSEGNPPQDIGASFASAGLTPFTGTYSTTGGEMGLALPANYSGVIAGCIEGDAAPPSGTYHFFQVLLAR